MATLSVRPARREDGEAAFAVIAARDRADLGFVDFTLGDVLDDLANPDAEVLLAEADGDLAAVALVDGLAAVVAVHPAREGQGIGTAFLEAVERHQRERGLDVLRQFLPATNEPGRRLLAHAGYRPEHIYLEMEADLAAVPPPVAGVAIRDLRRPEEDRVAHRILNTAFADIADHTDAPFDAWRERNLDASGALLHLVAEVGGEPAGALTAHDRDGLAWVNQLGVDAAARGRGLGRALLLDAFARFRAAGFTKGGLAVNATNEGAFGLYASVGLREVRRSERWEKLA